MHNIHSYIRTLHQLVEKEFEIDLHIATNTDAGSTLIGATVEKIHLPEDFAYKMENHKLYLFYYIKACI